MNTRELSAGARITKLSDGLTAALHKLYPVSDEAIRIFKEELGEFGRELKSLSIVPCFSLIGYIDSISIRLEWQCDSEDKTDNLALLYSMTEAARAFERLYSSGLLQRGDDDITPPLDMCMLRDFMGLDFFLCLREELDDLKKLWQRQIRHCFHNFQSFPS